MKTQDFYENYIKAVVFSDEELLEAVSHFKALSEMLSISGFSFSHSHRAANEAYINLRQYAVSRGLIKVGCKKF